MPNSADLTIQRQICYKESLPNKKFDQKMRSLTNILYSAAL